MASFFLTGSQNVTSGGSYFTPQEIPLYTSLFSELKKTTDGFVNGGDMAEFLNSSGLPRRTLHDIWSLCDTANLGRLHFDSFCRCCRLVAHAQQGALAITPELLALEPLRLPFFSIKVSPVSWSLSASELEGFKRVFAEYCDGLIIKGDAAKNIFVKSGLSDGDLSLIWDLADRDRDGNFDFGEFLVAMAVISKSRKEGSVPTIVPDDIVQLFSEKRDPVIFEHVDRDSTSSKASQGPHLLKLAESESRRLEEATAARLKYNKSHSKATVAFLQAERELEIEQTRGAQLQDVILSYHSRISDAENDLEQLGVGNAITEVTQNISWLESSTRELTAKKESLAAVKSQTRFQLKAEKEIFAQKSRDKALLQASNNRLKDKLNELRGDQLRRVNNRAELTSTVVRESTVNASRRDSKGVKLTDQAAKLLHACTSARPDISSWETFGAIDSPARPSVVETPWTGMLDSRASK